MAKLRASRRTLLCTLLVLLVVVVPVMARDTIILEVALTHRDPNKNIVQDYGDISWTELLEREFRKEYPYVDIEWRHANKDQVIVTMAAGIGPDIINGQGSWFASIAQKGGFADLSALMERDGIDFMANQTYWPPQWAEMQYMGRVYALPQYLGTMAMFYNADMFAEAGIVEPDPNIHTNTMTWDELEAIAKKLTKDTTGDGITDVWGFNKELTVARIYYWMKAAGAEFYGNEERTVSALNSPEAVEALEFIQGLRWESEVLAPPGAPQDWTKGQSAIYEMGSWRLVDWLGVRSDGTPKLSFAWNVFPMPIGPSGERATLATNDAYAINKQTKHLEEAWALTKFLAGPTANEIMAKYLALQPAHRDVVPEYIDLMRELNRDAREIDVHVFTDAGPYAYPKLYYAQPDLAEGIIADAYRKIFDNYEPVGPVWSEAITRLNRMLATVSQPTGPRSITWEGDEWTSTDINTLVPGGATVRDDGALVVTASGSDIWSYQDGLGFVYREVEGDFTATVRLHSAPTTHDWSKSGLMVRASEEAGAPNVAVLGTAANGLVMQVRPKLGEKTTQANKSNWTNDQPIYLRLIRKGDRVTGQMSMDGTEWTTLATSTVDLPNRALIGMASTSHNSGTAGDAVFTDWSIN